MKNKEMKTIKVPVYYNKCHYLIETGIEGILTEQKDYYIADDYKKPTKVKFIDYHVGCRIDKISIFASCYNYITDKIEFYEPCNLYKSKKTAGDIYLNNRWGNKEIK